MYAGKIVETGLSRDIFYKPKHPYTSGLLESMPSAGQVEKTLTSIKGTPPDLFAPPKGCSFAPRCKYCMNICTQTDPDEVQLENGHKVSCWLMNPQAEKRELPGRKSRLSTQKPLKEGI
jgi:oligopeptide transport system ATP-binding protein